MEKKYLSVEELSEYLHLAVNGIYNKVNAGTLPYLKPCGGKLLFDRDEIDKWIREQSEVQKKAKLIRRKQRKIRVA